MANMCLHQERETERKTRPLPFGAVEVVGACDALPLDPFREPHVELIRWNDLQRNTERAEQQKKGTFLATLTL